MRSEQRPDCCVCSLLTPRFSFLLGAAANLFATARTYTGQQADGTGLMYYHARYYDPTAGQFISPDSLVPDPTNVMDYNRYAYARANPFKFSDPTGHAACSTEFCWKNRWYRAHGYFFDSSTSHWSSSGQAQFDDPEILSDTVGEAGIEFVSGMFGLSQWTFHEMELMGQGIVALANKVGGFVQLHSLLGGGRTVFERERANLSFVGACVGFGQAQIPGVYQNWVTVFDGIFAGSDDYARGTAVHELAHVIDFNSVNGNGWLSTYVPKVKQSTYDVGKYGRNNGDIEYFAETVALWVYDTPSSASNAYGNDIGLYWMPIPANLQSFLEVSLVTP